MEVQGDDPKVSVEVAHDRKGVVLSTPDDVIDLPLAEAHALFRTLRTAIEVAEKNEPPAPAPLSLDKDGYSGQNKKVAEEFCHCYKCLEQYASCSVVIGGFEIGIEKAEEIRDWLNRALEYHNKSWCRKDD